MPVLGNHEADGHGYFDYFYGPGVNNGKIGERRKGWYSYDSGDSPTSGWHIVAINSECVGDDCDEEQMQWLTQDLANTQKPCVLAYMHHPRFSTGSHGDDSDMQEVWEVLNDNGVDVLLSGHDHHYERFQLRDRNGNPSLSGVRQFVVGTGGKGLRSVDPGPYTQAANVETHGILEMTLRENSYDWNFIRADIEGNGNFTDFGSTMCHD